MLSDKYYVNISCKFSYFLLNTWIKQQKRYYAIFTIYSTWFTVMYTVNQKKVNQYKSKQIKKKIEHAKTLHCKTKVKSIRNNCIAGLQLNFFNLTTLFCSYNKL